jgi:hypothetical protein
MNSIEYISSGLCDDILIYSNYDCGYDYSICLCNHGMKYIARKGELYINDKLVLNDETSLDKFITGYAPYFRYVIICIDGGVEIYEGYNNERSKIRLQGKIDCKLMRFA